MATVTGGTDASATSSVALAHGTTEVSPGVRIHYSVAGDGPWTVPLIHG